MGTLPHRGKAEPAARVSGVEAVPLVADPQPHPGAVTFQPEVYPVGTAMPGSVGDCLARYPYERFSPRGRQPDVGGDIKVKLDVVALGDLGHGFGEGDLEWLAAWAPAPR